MIIAYFGVKTSNERYSKNPATKFALFGTKFMDRSRFWANGAQFGLHLSSLFGSLIRRVVLGIETIPPYLRIP
jgi:hypothetical protein